VLVITSSFLLCCFSCTCFSLINYSTLSVRRREKHGSCSSIEGHHWLHRSRTAQACTHLCKGSIGRARCECTTRTLLLFAGVEKKPHVQTKLDNLLVFQSLFKYRKILGFSESLKQSCLNFLLSGFHAWIFLSQVFYTGATVNLTHDDVVLKSDSVVKSECDKTLEEITRRRVNCLPWLGSLPLRQAEHSSRSYARPNMFALQTSQSKALYTMGTWHCGIYSDSFEHGFWWTEFAFTCEARFVRIAFYECVDKVLCWAKARVATSRRYLWPGYWR
jgi:hypothetical protein